MKWKHNFGDGSSSKKIALDIIERKNDNLNIRNKLVNNFMKKNYMNDLDKIV